MMRIDFRHGSNWICAGISFALLFGLAFAYYFYPGGSIAGVDEESVGYRYFYSLRIAKGHEFPWIPQGHLTTLSHVLIQYGLSAAGLPDNQLVPRIDTFVFIAALVPGLLWLIGVLILMRCYRNAANAWLIVAAITYLMTAPPLPGHWAAIPDYHAWVAPLAVFTACWTIHVLSREPRPASMTESLLLGAYGGLAIGTKPTYLIFPLFVGLAMILTSQPERNLLHLIKCVTAGSMVTAIVAALIFFAYYGFQLDRVNEHFELLQNFVLTQQQTLAKIYTTSELLDFFATQSPLMASVLAPFGLAAAACIAGRYRLILLAAFAPVSILIDVTRFYGNTHIEMAAYASCQLAVMLWLLETRTVHVRVRWARYGYGLAAIAFSLFLFKETFDYEWTALKTQLNSSKLINASAQTFREKLAEGPKPVWILTTENEYRLLSIEGGICKGGMSTNSPAWGQSPYVARLFPDFRCAVWRGGFERGTPLQTVGFLRYFEEGPLPVSIQRVEKYFNVSLASHTCHEARAAISAFVYCLPNK
jgi:hypothetical protein